MAEKQKVTLQIAIEDPIQAGPALYSNFVAISRLNTDVQLEFMFLDLNQVALVLQQAQQSKSEKGEADQPTLIKGKSVSKVVLPGPAFVQLRENINELYKAIEHVLTRVDEVVNERRTGS